MCWASGFLTASERGLETRPGTLYSAFQPSTRQSAARSDFTAAPIHWALQSDPLLQSSSFPLSETIFALFFSSRFLQAPPRSSYFLSPSKKSFEQMEKKNWRKNRLRGFTSPILARHFLYFS